MVAKAKLYVAVQSNCYDVFDWAFGALVGWRGKRRAFYPNHQASHQEGSTWRCALFLCQFTGQVVSGARHGNFGKAFNLVLEQTSMLMMTTQMMLVMFQLSIYLTKLQEPQVLLAMTKAL